MSTLFNADWRDWPLLAVDTETTGPNPDVDRIVTATTVLIDGPTTTPTTWLADPGIPISDGAAEVHGITNEVAQRDGRPAAFVIAEIANVLRRAIDDGTPLVLFNACFDLTLIDRECRRHGVELDLTRALVIDGFVIDKAVDRFRKGKRTLTATCEHYGVRLDDAHDATEDALAAARVAWRLAQRFPDQVCVDLAVLHERQKVWRRDWAESFGQYLVKQGKTDDVERDWPVAPLPLGWTPDALPVERVAS
ncbi:3'-5' exonuclease [Knoellia sp. LjRoot47]|uniref:3'-5' exonuclease n=1 Tax=Knoellia sp. LjRoot47 TaxID=3342330 RepID=UPI003ED10569